MRRLAPALALTVLAALLGAGCGRTEAVHESPVVVSGGTSGAGASRTGRSDDAIRIAVVTHGQASSPFWATVRNGVEAAARENDVLVSYRAPDVYSVQRMRTMIDRAVASRPDGLVVSIPESGVAPAIRRATRAGIPVVSINSGNETYGGLGVLAHVGQPENRAGFRAGRRLAAAGVRRALCVNQQVGNQGLDARCEGLARAMRRVGGTSRVIGVDDQSSATPRRLAAAITSYRIDGLLALNANLGRPGRRGDPPDRPCGLDHRRDVRPRTRGAASGPQRAPLIRRRPAAILAGLLARHNAGPARALRALPGRARGHPHRSQLRDQNPGGESAGAEQAVDSMTRLRRATPPGGDQALPRHMSGGSATTRSATRLTLRAMSSAELRGRSEP